MELLEPAVVVAVDMQEAALLDLLSVVVEAV
jgi:hypothetical protein